MNIFFIIPTVLLLAYLLGSVPFGLIIVHLLTRKDIRQIGSGNIGTTNVRRVVGTKWALVTLSCDVVKGLAPTTAALYVISAYHLQHHWLVPMTAAGAVLGHMFPVYFRFKPGGKGVATMLGAFIVPAPWACLLALAAFVITVKLSRIVSMGSMIGMFLLSPAIYFTTGDILLTIAAIFLMIMVFSRHRENIERLANGREPLLGGRKEGKQKSQNP